MSANKKKAIYIDVTRGDCVETNRKGGKSNTGTYFICSTKNFDDFDSFFDSNKSYQIDLNKIKTYKVLFDNFFMKFKDLYFGKMESFAMYINYLLSFNDFPLVKVELRINDSRVFMRFADNSDKIVNALRNILYEDLSLLVIEERNNKFLIYPAIIDSNIDFQMNNDISIVVDED